MVRAGSSLTFAVTGTTGGFVRVDPTDMRGDVVDRLSLFLVPIAVTITKGTWFQDALNFEWWHWDYTATVTVKTRIDHNAIDDVRSIVANAFYTASGVLPTVSVTGEPTGAAVVNTGGLGGAFEQLADRLQMSAFVLVVGVVGVVALLAYGPNVGQLARVAR